MYVNTHTHIYKCTRVHIPPMPTKHILTRLYFLLVADQQTKQISRNDVALAWYSFHRKLVCTDMFQYAYICFS